MRAFLHEIKFPSTESTYFLDITDKINAAIIRAKVREGFVFVNTKHTTLGIVVNEIAEPNLLKDILHHTLHTIPEDRRSTRVSKEYAHPTTDYRHRCQDNPYCNEIDEDYNAAAHIRTLTYSHPSVVVPVLSGKLELGKYQQVAAFEFDGRDGKGKNPIRQRTIQVWICPAEKITKI
ncbi:MAG: YjbQ family protein [Patescibacteria group bacterium]